MDIAKIRKKLKAEKEAQQTGNSTLEKEKATESPEDIMPAITQAEKEQTPKDTIVPETKDTTTEKPILEEDKSAVLPIEVKEEPSQKIPEEKPELKQEKDDIIELLTFKLSDEDYAFKVSDVEEILRSQKVTLLPRVHEFIIGVTSLRGKIIPLIDLRKRFLLKDVGDRSKAKILILKGEKGSIGVFVDKVVDVVRIPAESIVNPPSHLTESELRFIEGVAFLDGRFISIVHCDEALNFKVGEK
ncbi:MAG: purine-binding chemotaxis protein CheW [Nitrospirae bacterium]|nr:purine-binding chemotaxis protein CheW [Nitrospirota bacterium]